jgi:hypothetical protein
MQFNPEAIKKMQQQKAAESQAEKGYDDSDEEPESFGGS